MTAAAATMLAGPVAATTRPAQKTYAETRDPAAAFDANTEIVQREEMARRIAREFRAARKYPIEAEELESEAILALTEAARDFPTTTTALPFGAFAAQRILWRLEDFIQAWYRLARRDFATGRPEVRRVVGLSVVDGMEGRRVGARAYEEVRDPNTGLYIEDCRRLVDTVLSDRAKQVLDLRYRERLNLKQVAAVMGIKHIRARQIHSEALAALRAAMGTTDDDGAAGGDSDAGD